MLKFYHQIKDGYVGLWKRTGDYWHAYGGLRALLSSPFFHIAIALNILFKGAWSPPGSDWWSHTIEVLPSMLGFTLGGYAIWLAIGDDKFRALISGPEEDGTASPFIELNAAFVHFILIQALALLYALGAASQPSLASSVAAPSLGDTDCILQYAIALLKSYGIPFTGYLLFLYALLTAVAATLQILRYSIWYDDWIDKNK
jgi:hypothetical protein